MDRDGVLNADVRTLAVPEQLKLLPGVAAAVRKINRSGFLAVVAKGLATERDVRRVHRRLRAMLKARGARLDGIYYCPHHPGPGVSGPSAYRKKCSCRKPATGLIRRAVSKFRIDVGTSYFIGDTTVDVLTGINAGLKTVLVRTGYGGKDGRHSCEPDFAFDNLGRAVNFIVARE